MDMHEFYMGNVFDAYEFFGAHPNPDGTVFRTFAPSAERITIIGEWNDWQEENMIKDGHVWSYFSAKAKKGQMYKYVIYSSLGRVEHCDPYGFAMELRPNFASIITSSISGCSIPNSLKLTGRPMYLKKCFNRDMPASAISSKSSFSGTPKTRFANRAIFFGLCSAMNVIHAGTITASPAPCVTLYTALISCSRKCDAQSSSQPTPQVPLWAIVPHYMILARAS